MASLSTTTAAAGIATSSSSPFLHKNYHIIKNPRIHNKNTSRFSRKFSCKASTNNNSNEQNPNRRNVLLGLGGLYGMAGLHGGDHFAFADPIAPPDISKCGPADLPAGADPVNCCPPFTSSMIDYKLPEPGKIRIRPAAHAVDKAYLDKFTKAVELMRALPDDDPRSFRQQANIHCAYCDGAYEQVGFPNLDIQVHNSWLFFPFHRWYLYFYERILGKLIGDPTFAMPFWNWDAQAGMQLPSIYANPSSSLYDPLRSKLHQPPTIMDLDYNGVDVPTPGDAQISSNLTIMYRQMVSNGRSPRLFMGSPYRAGDPTDPGAGSLENIPHGPVHIWTGDQTQPNFENMGNFYSAGRDPIFYAHHSNVDRMWSVWKTLGGRRQDFTDRDWLDAAFLFYDENAQLVRVKVRDCVDSRKLGYEYQKVDIPWMNTRPTPRRSPLSRVKRALGRVGVPMAQAAGNEFQTTLSFPVTLDKTVKILVARPKKSKRSKKEKEDADEILVIDGIEFDRNVPIKFDVYINDEDDLPSGPDKSEFAGSYVSVPHKHKGHSKLKTCLTLGITDLLEDLDAEDDEHVVVTLVPKLGVGQVSIGSIKIEFDT
ncbi:polyphenol oxidase, chloroplastic-like [Humulus lupulus]|uniref:polyphenol oxidase, chloroplastic-like n=1 Tax=Humulus lupulus TaxID=3486 RepID=UPI002B4099C6|nr:polyphenol oxidase, chloroplastic-like [Humulus lupulus]